MTEIDGRALVGGGGVAFASLFSLFWLFGELGAVPESSFGATVGLLVLGVLPGSIVAGSLHSTDRTGAACYGMAAIVLGAVLPLAAGSILFFVLFEFSAGSPGIVSLLSMGLAVPVLASVVLCGGGIRGVIGARLRERPG